MKIRTITTGVNIQSVNDTKPLVRAIDFNDKASKIFEDTGYEVQTTRIATNSWEEYLQELSSEEVIKAIVQIENLAKENEVSFFSIGRARNPERISLLPEINKETSIISCSAHIGDIETGILSQNIEVAASTMKRIAEETENGYGNFRFCASANCKPGIPFFPTGFHEGEKAAFGIGVECGDLAMKAFSVSKNLDDARQNFRNILEEEYKKVEELAERISKEEKVAYNGIDVSLNPGLQENESIAYAFEKLGFGRFGSPGTLSIAGMVTDVLKNLSIKTCGYSGLMLPVCEDAGLAQGASESNYNISNLLLYSSVCGCGLDTVPIAGDTSAEKIEAILYDTAMLAIKLDKPLSVRLLIVPGTTTDDSTAFNSPYLVESKVLEV